MANFFQRGGLWVLGQAALMSAVVVLGLVGRTGSGSPTRVVLGVLFLVCAAVCGVAGTVALGRGLTPFPRPAEGARLVARGIYGFMRHPLYVAVFCAALAWALLWRSWPALAATVVLGLFLDLKARHEERWLLQHFRDYAVYQRRVRRFVPWIY